MSRMNEDQGGWRPADMYSTYGGSQGVTYSSVTYGSASSAGSSVPVLSSSNSLFRHRGVSSYAPASSGFQGSGVSSLPFREGVGVGSQAALHTTSSAEFRSFGGGGNAGGVSMSGGAIKSSGSSMSAPSSALSVSMPAAPAFAYNRGVLPSVAGDIAMASTQSYAGIGHTTGGGPRGMSSRRNALGFGDSWWVWFDKWLSQDSDGDGVLNGAGYGSDGSYTFDKYTLMQAYHDFINSGVWNTGMTDTPSFEEWLDWYLQAMSDGGGSYIYNGHTYSWLPIGDVWPLVVMLLFYAGYVFVRRRKQQTAINN